jgi:hypothetical protein
MADEIASHYRWEIRDAVNAAAAHQRFQFRSPIVQFGKYFAIAILALVVAAALLSVARPPRNGESPAVSLVTIAFCLGLMAYLCSPKGPVNRWWIGHKVRSIPEASRSVEWSFDDEMLWVRSPLSESTFRWELFKTIVETPDCFLFYQGDIFVLWVPGHGFSSPQAIRRFADLARVRVPHYVTLGECRYPAKPESVGLEEL